MRSIGDIGNDVNMMRLPWFEQLDASSTTDELATFIWHTVSVLYNLPNNGTAKFFQDLLVDPQMCKVSNKVCLYLKFG